MKEEFLSEVESGFGFIFESDIDKYWRGLFSEDITDEVKAELIEMLNYRALLR